MTTITCKYIYILFHVCVLLHPCPCFLMRIPFYFSCIRLHVYAFAIDSMVHCGIAFEPGASGLPYYCTPPVCIPAVFGALAVCRQNSKKKNSVLKMNSVRTRTK